jgi:hypothetical protein
MFSRHRRYFAVLTFLLLATPLAAGIVRPDGPAAVLREGRRLAPAPRPPQTGAEWFALSGRIDDYLKDHFGFRQALIRVHKDLTRPILGLGTDTVLVGRNGRMFYLGEEMVRQSAGLILRDKAVSDTADLLAKMKGDLARRGIGFLVASPPNSATMYQDDLPDWAQNRGRRTEYDAFLDELAARGVSTIDLRPAMKGAQSRGPAYFMHDSHWTARGALAGFNAIAVADSHPDWRLEPRSALGPLKSHPGGDLARLLGVEDSVDEQSEDLILPMGTKELLSSNPFGDYVETSDKLGPTIMIIGDSFTGGYFDKMLMRHVGRVVWVDRDHCGFDWKAIDRYRPDEVWWMPTERFLLCDPGSRPTDFTG